VLKVSPTHSKRDITESYGQRVRSLYFYMNNLLLRSNNILHISVCLYSINVCKIVVFLPGE
jgi:hypothetical protein